MTVDASKPRPGEKIAADTLPDPRAVAIDAPWHWLAAGWSDLWRHPAASLAYGAIFAALAGVLWIGLLAFNALPLLLALAGGFLLLGPLLAVGLYDISQRSARGDVITLGSLRLPSAEARGQLAFAGALLLLAFFVWIEIALLLMMLFLGGSAIPPASEFTRMLLFTPQGLGLLIVGTATGALLAATVFVGTAFSLPMLASRRTDVFSAMAASARAIRKNPKAMLLWAALIVVIMAAGFATLMVGLVIAFPLIGHATWHAFVDVFGSDV